MEESAQQPPRTPDDRPAHGISRAFFKVNKFHFLYSFNIPYSEGKRMSRRRRRRRRSLLRIVHARGEEEQEEQEEQEEAFLESQRARRFLRRNGGFERE